MKTVITTILVKILFVDLNTNETLPGVKVQTEKHIYYSDLNGNLIIPKNEKIIDISSISYQNLKNLKLNNDTIIKLN